MPGKLVSRMSKRECYTLNVSDTVKEASKRLHEKKIRHILIMEDKKLLGIVSIGDVVNHLIAKIKEENKNLKDYINSY